MTVWKNLDPKKIYQKSVEFLLRKGFEYEVVKMILDHLDVKPDVIIKI